MASDNFIEKFVHERRDKARREQVAAYYKDQHELFEDQKKYTRTIHSSTVVTAVASCIMAIATVVMAI